MSLLCLTLICCNHIIVAALLFQKFIKDSNLCDQLIIHTDGLGNLMAVNIAPSAGTSLDLDLNEFTTKVTVVMPSLAPGSVSISHSFIL